MAPQHKKPPLSWCIVFQHITHCRSSSFCWSCSGSTRRGGLEVTESAELLFPAFIVFTWSPSKKIQLHWKNPSVSLWRMFHGNIDNKCQAQIYGSLQASQWGRKRKYFKDNKTMKPAGCPESIQFVSSWNHCVGRSLIPDRCRTHYSSPCM